MVIPWLLPASTIVRSVLLVFWLEVEGVIHLSPLRSCVRSLAPNVVEPGLRVVANRAVRLNPLVRNDLGRPTPTPGIAILKEAKFAISEKNSDEIMRISLIENC